MTQSNRSYESAVRRWLCVIVCGALSIGWAAQGLQAADDAPDFAHDIVPILQKHCVACHGGNESEGGLSLNTRSLLLESGAIDPAHPADSALIMRIRSSDPKQQMPPPDKPRLSEAEVGLLSRWIESQLPWESGFTFAADRYEPPLVPRRPTLPPAQEGRDHPLDRILDHYWMEQGIARPAPLADGPFLRRLSLDLTGLLPTAAELAAFEADSAPDKREKMIDQLLQRREAYAAHWLTLWNDLLRNAYSGTGYIDGGRTQVTGWLYRSLVDNLSYDTFVRELITPHPDAAGFIHGIQWRGNVNASQRRELQFAQGVSQVFLGINLKCASCHDSFIDRWTLAETYSLAAVIAQEPLELHRCDKPQGTQATAAWIFPELGQIDAQAPPSARLRQLAQLMTHPQNGRLTRTIVNRLWDRMMGRGIVAPVDAMHTRPWNEDLLDYLAVDLADHGFDMQHTLRRIATSAAYQSASVTSATDPAAEPFVFRGPLPKRMTAEQFVDGLWLLTDTWPRVQPDQFQRDGRNQRGQFRDLLLAVDRNPDLPSLPVEQWPARWGDRRVRAAFLDLDVLQANLGRPIREQVVSSRPGELTTLQAIQLANGPELASLLERGAERLLAVGPTQPDAIVNYLYQTALSRSPTAAEQSLAIELLSANSPDTASGVAPAALVDLLWIVAMLPEFQWVR